MSVRAKGRGRQGELPGFGAPSPAGARAKSATATPRAVPRGYKMTDAGTLPVDWEVRRLGDLGDVVRGGSPRPAGDARFFDGDHIPWLTVACLTGIPASQLLVTATPTRLTADGAKRSRTLEQGTLVIVNSGARTLGVSKVLSIACCANDGIAALVNQRNGDKRFLCYYLNTQTKRLREVVAAGNDQLNLNTSRIALIPVPFPDDDEQRAIAGALSDADALIESLQQLVAKKRQVKHGAMQVLLTGKRRLPGFSGEWEVKRLGEVADVKKGELITEEDAIPGSIPVIAGGKKPSYFHSRANRVGKTITVSGSGASAGYVSFFDVPIFASDCSTISEGPNYVTEFIYSVLLLQQEQIYRAQTGGAQPHIHPNDLRPMSIPVPPKAEQAAIAAVLSDMDAEIAALEAKLAKARQVKQGMMQELLTGKIRLV